MMNKSKSTNINVMRFLFILPLLVVVLLAFRSVATVNNHYPEKKNITDTVPTPSPKITGKAIVTKDDLLKQKGVREILVKTKNNESTARVTLTDGTVKTFNLNDPEEKEAFERAYGDLTPPAPPTPVAPAHAPRAVAAPTKAIPAKPAAPVATPDEIEIVAPVAVPATPAAPKAPAAPKKVDVQIRGTGTVTHEVPATVTGTEKTGTGEVTMVMTEAPVVTQTKKVDIVATGTVTFEPAEVVEVRNVTPVTESKKFTLTLAKPGQPAKATTASGEVIEVRNVQPIKLKLVEAKPTFY